MLVVSCPQTVMTGKIWSGDFIWMRISCGAWLLLWSAWASTLSVATPSLYVCLHKCIVCKSFADHHECNIFVLPTTFMKVKTFREFLKFGQGGWTAKTWGNEDWLESTGKASLLLTFATQVHVHSSSAVNTHLHLPHNVLHSPIVYWNSLCCRK